ncbi:tyrosine-type recombinase/integrase [Fimbriiglobus ruber]|uniref:Integrase n=1 Tax=Fimbriiglobus ruber TaxID=1908690 RepID=A0A225CZX3_9BACT|nr:site-specific integrase [Fimbriiglobus ruber]OWK34233.1 Integrase [Fimbriiglobus ruber]
MAKKKGSRGQGEGSALPHGDGQFRAKLPGPNGPGRSKVFDRKTDALAWIREHVDRPKDSGTLGEWLDEWIAIQETQVEAKTVGRDKEVIESLIRPDLAKCLVADHVELAAKVRKWLTSMMKAGKSADQRHRAFSTLSKILRSHPTLPNSTLDKITPPKVVRAKRRSLTLEQFVGLVKVADDFAKRPHFGIIVRLGVECCTRPRELIALRWEDYDGRQIKIVRAICPETGEVKGLKNEFSRRTVPLTMPTITALDTYRKVCKSTDWIFPGTSRGHISYYGLVSQWKVLAAAAGLKGWVPGELRHTGATLLMSSGANVLSVARRLGHSDPSMVLRVYGHALQNDQIRLTDAFLGMYNAPVEPISSGLPRVCHTFETVTSEDPSK